MSKSQPAISNGDDVGHYLATIHISRRNKNQRLTNELREAYLRCRNKTLLIRTGLDGPTVTLSLLARRDGGMARHGTCHVTTPTIRFLDLPGEIRNIIYEFALTHTEALNYTEPYDQTSYKAILYTDYRPIPYSPAFLHEFNQLQYVSKQLYRDSAALELRYNAISFDEFEKMEGDIYPRCIAVAQFLTFWCHLEPIWHSVLQKVYLRNDRDYDHPTYYNRSCLILDLDVDLRVVDDLLKICHQNPHFTVYWEVHGFTAKAGPDFMLIGFTLIEVARNSKGEGCFNPFPIIFGHVWDMQVRSFRDLWFGGKQLPSNLRLMPQGNFNPFDWMRGLQRVAPRFSWWPELMAAFGTDGVLGSWLDLAHKWHRNGV